MRAYPEIIKFLNKIVNDDYFSDRTKKLIEMKKEYQEKEILFKLTKTG